MEMVETKNKEVKESSKDGEKTNEKEGEVYQDETYQNHDETIKREEARSSNKSQSTNNDVASVPKGGGFFYEITIWITTVLPFFLAHLIRSVTRKRNKKNRQTILYILF